MEWEALKENSEKVTISTCFCSWQACLEHFSKFTNNDGMEMALILLLPCDWSGDVSRDSRNIPTHLRI